MKKRILALLISIVMIMSIAPTSMAIDNTETTCEENTATKSYNETKESVPAEAEKETTIDNANIQAQGNIPESLSLSTTQIKESDYNEAIYDIVDESTEIFACDITLENVDGSKWQPASGENVSVTLSVPNTEDGDKIEILHDDGTGIENLGEYEVENGEITFETPGFSTFYFCLKFEFGDYEYTLSGMTEIYLSQLMNSLNISTDISEVKDITFSDSSYMEITRLENDWLLRSLEPFGSEEYLTITFTDGKVLEIKVTDPVIYNYAVGSDITNVTKLNTQSITMGTVTSGDENAEKKKYIVNSDQITQANVRSAGEETANADVDMIIYATEGMAIRFEAGTHWPGEEGSRPTHGTNDVWYWSWDGTYNYAVIDENAAGKNATFRIKSENSNSGYYCDITLCVVEKSEPELLEDALKKSGLSGYTIKDVPVTLYNYDGKAFNEYYNSKTGNYFAFSGVSKGVNSTENAGNRGWTTSGVQANGGGSVALMGIVKQQLENNLPVMSQGQKVDVFSQSEGNGKEVYEDVDFQFVYNENTGYYTYNGALNHAQYDKETNKIRLYKQSLAPSDTPNGASHGNAGFYPFEDINKAFTNTGYNEISWDEWAKKLETDAFELTPSQYSADIVTTSSTAPASTADMHYGIQVASDFYLPEGKKLNGQEMIYEFTGDDDLWVFIDGNLVLDIGGGHTYVSGSFNLTTGEVWVEKYTKLAASDGGYYEEREQGENLTYTDSFLNGLDDDQMHTIQIFYLERHSGVSNCRMRFNLPLVPSNSVNVSKNLENQNNKKLSVTPATEYTFSLYTAAGNNDNIDAQEKDFTVLKGAPYTVTGVNAPTEIQYTDEQTGKFTLKEGQIASFAGIERFTEVYAVEDKPDDGYIYETSKVSVNKGDFTAYEYGDKTDIKVMPLNSSINFDFVNYIKTQPLTIEKEVINGLDGLLNESQEFTFSLDFTKEILETAENAIQAQNEEGTVVTLTDGGKFNLAHSEYITIPFVPVNMTFQLSETNPDSTNNSFDSPVFNATVCESVEESLPTAYQFDTSYNWIIKDDAANKLLVQNLQRFNLVISKTGIDELDHHDADSPHEEERQSTLYKVTGPDDFELTVAICGNGSKTITKLPVGKYSVEELTDWSWRYEIADQAKKFSIVDPDSFTENVEYENLREWIYWLSGDSYCRNLFKRGN